METITVSEYASLRGCTEKNVYNWIYRNRKPVGVLDWKKSGKTYLLFVNKSLIINIKTEKVRATSK